MTTEHTEHTEKAPSYLQKLIGGVLLIGGGIALTVGLVNLFTGRSDAKPKPTTPAVVASSGPARMITMPTQAPPPVGKPAKPAASQAGGKAELSPLEQITEDALAAEYSTLMGVNPRGGRAQPVASRQTEREHREFERVKEKREEALVKAQAARSCAEEVKAGRYDCAKSLGYQGPGQGGAAAAGGSGSKVSDKPLKAQQLGEELLAPGTLVDATLENDTDSSFGGSVSFLVARDVYSADRQSILMPAGSRLLGNSKTSSANNAQSITQPRQAVMAQLLVYPSVPGDERSGQSVDLSDATASLDEDGIAAIKGDLEWPWKEWGLGLLFNVATSAPGYMIRQGGGFGAGGYGSPQSQALSGLTQDLNSTGKKVGDRFLQVNPRKHLYANQPVEIRTLRPIYLKPWKRIDQTAYEVTP